MDKGTVSLAWNGLNTALIVFLYTKISGLSNEIGDELDEIIKNIQDMKRQVDESTLGQSNIVQLVTNKIGHIELATNKIKKKLKKLDRNMDEIEIGQTDVRMELERSGIIGGTRKRRNRRKKRKADSSSSSSSEDFTSLKRK